MPAVAGILSFFFLYCRGFKPVSSVHPGTKPKFVTTNVVLVSVG